MKKRSIATLLIAALILAALSAGCSGTDPQSAQTGASPMEPDNHLMPSAASPNAGQEGQTYFFTDFTGREVELPANIERIIPAGPLAQIVLFTLVPDKLVGLASALTGDQLQYMDDRFRSLPEIGHFSAGTFNLESVMVAAPQVIIDIGQASPGLADDMQSIQERTGIPTVFVQLDDIETMLTGYATLGGLLGASKQADRIISYISENILSVIERAEAIPDSQKARVYFGQNDGLTAMIANSIHSDVIDFAGGRNVADVEQTVRGGAAEISMEQLILWNPDIILFASGSIYDTVASLNEWSALRAVREGSYYEIPQGPYNWLGRPPSVNRLLGIRWLASLFHPEIFPFDMAQETREFYKLFYHWDLTDEQIGELLSRTT